MGTPTVANDWTDEYESIVEFYFWEPQHLNRRAPPGRNPGIDEVLQRLRRKEVPLNHLLGILFRLIPASLSARLLSSIAGVPIGSTARFVNNADLRRSPAYGGCQPDFMFQISDGSPSWKSKWKRRHQQNSLPSMRRSRRAKRLRAKLCSYFLARPHDSRRRIAFRTLPRGSCRSAKRHRLAFDALVSKHRMWRANFAEWSFIVLRLPSCMPLWKRKHGDSADSARATRCSRI